MKFTNGNWLIQDDVTAFYPHHVYESEVEKDALTIYCPDRDIINGKDTTDGRLLSIRFSSPMSDVICVQMTHFIGEAYNGPNFEINQIPDTAVSVEDHELLSTITSGNACAQISKQKPLEIEFLGNGKKLTATGSKRLGYMKCRNGMNYMMNQLDIGVGEYLYGLGEQFRPFVKNGQTIDIWNRDGGTASEQAYKNVPFYLTNKGYGVFVRHTGCVSFEAGTERVSKMQFSVPGETLEYYVIYGPKPKDIIQKYTALTGKPALPPAWSFGIWMSTSFIGEFSEQAFNDIIDGMQTRDLPLSVFHIDCFWMRKYRLCDLTWNKALFPEPEKMLLHLKQRGMNLSMWINPYVAQFTDTFQEGKENGYLLKKTNGAVWQTDLWQPGMGVVDFTNPNACKWFADKLRKLLDMGVNCFKTDFGERIPTDVVYYDHSDPEKMHNYYPYLYNKLVFETIEEKHGKNHAMVFARSATAGCQKFPIHWGGDCTSTYESMAESLRGGLSFALSGFGFWSHDIGGFEEEPSADIYKRWVAFGLLSSHSRLHGSGGYRVPWVYDDEAVNVLRLFSKLKMRLMPYIFAKACEATRDGIPFMRPMMLEFPDDPCCSYLDRQYMFGDNLLVAPVLSADGSVDYFLPKGKWTNFLNGEKTDGGDWKNENYDYFGLPLMARPNSIIAVGAEDSKAEYDYANNVTLHVYELENGGSATVSVFNTEGERELDVTVSRQDYQITIAYTGSGKPFQVLLTDYQQFKQVKNAEATETEKGVTVTPDWNETQASVLIDQ